MTFLRLYGPGIVIGFFVGLGLIAVGLLAVD